MSNNNSTNMDVSGGSIAMVGGGTVTLALAGSGTATITATGLNLFTFPAASCTLAGLSIAETFTALQTFNAGVTVPGITTLGHVVAAGATPGIAAGAGAGTSPTISIAGTDTDGVVTITSDTLPTLAAVVATITFAAAFGATPKSVVISPANANAAGLSGATMVYADIANVSTTQWQITAGATALIAATTYKWYYKVVG